MTLFQIISLILVVLCCTGGVVWLFYDIDKQLKALKRAHEESTLGLVEEDEEE